MSIYYVYKVTNKVTGDYYFGARTSKVMNTRTPEEDLWIHYFTSSKYVKQQIDQYGKDSFTAVVLHTYDDVDLTDFHEQVYIYYHISDPRCLNKHYVCPHNRIRRFSCAGLKRTAEQNKRNSEHRKGKPVRRKDGSIVKREAGFKHSEETKAKIGAKHKGKTQPRDAIERQRQKVLGRKPSVEERAKISAAMKGHKVSDETRKKIGAANAITLRGRKLSPETIAKRTETYKRNRAAKLNK